MGFSVDDLRDPAKNIEIGLTYLKQGLDKFGDPMLAVAGYNAGHNHPYFADPENRSLPDSTKEYLREINKNGGFAEPEAQEAPPQTVDTPASEEDFAAQKAQLTANALAAGSGAALSKGLDITANIGKTSEAIRQLPGALAAAKPVAGGPAGPVGGPASSGAKWLQNWGGISKEGFSGGVPEGAAQYNKMKPQGQIMQGLAKKGLITPQPVQPGVFTGGQLSISGQPPASPPVAPPQAPGPLSQAAGALKQGAGAVLRSPVTMGALGGLSVLESGGEAISRTKTGDPTGANIAAAGGVGGVMQMLPLPLPLKAVGAAVAAASPLTLYLRDKINNQTPMPDPTEQELLEAQSPAFRYARP
jgi:hypothetical protein